MAFCCIERTLSSVEQATTDATRACQPAPYSGRVELLRATAQYSRLEYEPYAGWGRLAANLRIHDVPGDHVTLLSAPWVATLGERLRTCLDEARAAVPTRQAAR